MTSCLVASVIISLILIPFDRFATRAVLYFIGVGLMGPFAGRYLFFVGVNRVGASIASPLSQTKPLYAAIAAVLILGETLTLSIILGTLLMIGGAAVISSEESGGKIEKEWSKKELGFPILAAACFGVAHILRKMGLNITPEPLVGLTVQNAAALAFFPLLVMAQGSRQSIVLRDKRAWLIFSLAGLFFTICQFCLFSALSLGQVIIVTPLTSLSPFFVLLLVGIFLKRQERVTWKLVLGTIFIVGGTLVLTFVS